MRGEMITKIVSARHAINVRSRDQWQHSDSRWNWANKNQWVEWPFSCRCGEHTCVRVRVCMCAARIACECMRYGRRLRMCQRRVNELKETAWHCECAPSRINWKKWEENVERSVGVAADHVFAVHISDSNSIDARTHSSLICDRSLTRKRAHIRRMRFFIVSLLLEEMLMPVLFGTAICYFARDTWNNYNLVLEASCRATGEAKLLSGSVNTHNSCFKRKIR